MPEDMLEMKGIQRGEAEVELSISRASIEGIVVSI